MFVACLGLAGRLLQGGLDGGGGSRFSVFNKKNRAYSRFDK